MPQEASASDGGGVQAGRDGAVERAGSGVARRSMREGLKPGGSVR